MKKLYTLLFFAFAVQLGHAQNPLLFDREWKLFQLVVDGESVALPVNDIDVSDVSLTFTPANEFAAPRLETRVCNQGGGNPEFSAAENSFFLNSIYVTLITCNDQGNNAFEGAYLMNFFGQNVPGPFNYEIYGLLNFSDTLILVITNESGDVAQYSDGNLSAKNFKPGQFVISPNPASDYLAIDFGNQSAAQISIEIYDNSGKLCLSEKRLEQNRINIQNLAKGMYFVKVRNGDTFSTQKFIKI